MGSWQTSRACCGVIGLTAIIGLASCSLLGTGPRLTTRLEGETFSVTVEGQGRYCSDGGHEYLAIPWGESSCSESKETVIRWNGHRFPLPSSEAFQKNRRQFTTRTNLNYVPKWNFAWLLRRSKRLEAKTFAPGLVGFRLIVDDTKVQPKHAGPTPWVTYLLSKHGRYEFISIHSDDTEYTVASAICDNWRGYWKNHWRWSKGQRELQRIARRNWTRYSHAQKQRLLRCAADSHRYRFAMLFWNDVGSDTRQKLFKLAAEEMASGTSYEKESIELLRQKWHEIGRPLWGPAIRRFIRLKDMSQIAKRVPLLSQAEQDTLLDFAIGRHLRDFILLFKDADRSRRDGIVAKIAQRWHRHLVSRQQSVNDYRLVIGIVSRVSRGFKASAVMAEVDDWIVARLPDLVKTRGGEKLLSERLEGWPQARFAKLLLAQIKIYCGQQSTPGICSNTALLRTAEQAIGSHP